jgi:osmotically-inducible protein OsmY
MSSDNDLKQAVFDEMRWEPSVEAAHIGVTAKSGVVTLTGHVDTYAQKSDAEKAASRVKGVKAVVENIEVKLPSSYERDDEDIAAAAIDRLGWNSSIPEDAVKVKVEGGWVTLTGEVAWNYEKSAAEGDIRTLMGVTGVSNQILLKPSLISTSDVRNDIERALHRSWYYDPNTIKVAADGGKITLTGTVTTWNARQLAGSAAWSAPGATSVENEISVIS